MVPHLLLIGAISSCVAGLKFQAPGVENSDPWLAWRYGNASKHVITAEVEHDSSRNAAANALRCQHILKPPAAGQFYGVQSCQAYAMTSSRNMFLNMLEAVDHVYYLCMSCHAVQLPETIKHKVSMVNGAEVDGWVENVRVNQCPLACGSRSGC